MHMQYQAHMHPQHMMHPYAQQAAAHAAAVNGMMPRGATPARSSKKKSGNSSRGTNALRNGKTSPAKRNLMTGTGGVASASTKMAMMGMAASPSRSIITSKDELRFIVEAAKRRYLDAHAVLFLLEMGAKGDIQPLQKVQRRPPSGSLFLYDRSRTPQFRVDGYEYVKKKGNAAAVREDHVKLKYDHEERVYACHVHSMERESMHRRSYWDLKNRNNLILVHYWDSEVSAQEQHPGDCICIGCTMGIDEDDSVQHQQMQHSAAMAAAAAAAAAASGRGMIPVNGSLGSGQASSLNSSSSSAMTSSRSGSNSRQAVNKSHTSTGPSTSNARTSVPSTRSLNSAKPSRTSSVTAKPAGASSSAKASASSSKTSSSVTTLPVPPSIPTSGGGPRLLPSPPSTMNKASSQLPADSSTTASASTSPAHSVAVAAAEAAAAADGTDTAESVSEKSSASSANRSLAKSGSTQVTFREPRVKMENAAPNRNSSSVEGQSGLLRKNSNRSNSSQGSTQSGSQQVQMQVQARVAPTPEFRPLSEAESAAQTRDDDVEMHAFLHDIDMNPALLPDPNMNFLDSLYVTSPTNSAYPRSPELVTLVDLNTLEIEDFAPNVACINGGTRMLISLSKIGGEPFTKSSLSVGVENIDVVFAKTHVVKGTMLANGVIRCETPVMPRNTHASLEVMINRTKIDLCESLSSAGAIVHFSLSDTSMISSVRADVPRSQEDPRLRPKSAEAALAPLVVHGLRPRFGVSPIGTPNSQNSDPRRFLKRKRSRRLPSPVPGAVPGTAEDIDDDRDMDQLNDEELTELSESLLERVAKVLVDLCKEEHDLLGELDALDDSGFNLLHYAVAFHHAKLVSLLLNHGADPNKTTSTGDTPLHLAAEVAEIGMAGELLAAGANPLLRDADGNTAAQLAEAHELPELVEILRPEDDDNQVYESFQSTGAAHTSASTSSVRSVASSISVASIALHNGTSVDSLSGDLMDTEAKPKESLEDKQQKMLRKALASMSLKDRCALSLGVRETDGTSVSSAVNGSPGASLSTPGHSRTSSFAGHDHVAASSSSVSSLHASANDMSDLLSSPPPRDPILGTTEERNDAKVKKIVTENGPNLVAVISNLNDEERHELESEARIIQTNIRRWLLRRSVLASRKMQTEAKGFRDKKVQLRDADLEEKATKVQAVGKGFLARREYKQARQEVIQVQAATRCLLARKNFHAWRRQLSATLVIQRSIREHRRRIHQAGSRADEDLPPSIPLHDSVMDPILHNEHLSPGFTMMHASNGGGNDDDDDDGMLNVDFTAGAVDDLELDDLDGSTH